MMERESIISLLRASTEEVFSTMLDMEIRGLEPFSEKKPPGPSAGVISVIGMTGTCIGTGSVCCDEALACRMASAMLMAEFTQVTEEVLDAMAEITNMIIGNFKTASEIELGPLNLSIPTVIFGMRFVARSASKEEWIVLPFEVAGHRLEIKLCLTANRGQQHFPLPGFVFAGQHSKQ